mgnify:CR=1 FL=1
MDNTKGKMLAVLASVMLLANVLFPIGIAFAEEGAPIVPEQVKSQETEKASNEQWENLDNQESQVKVLDQIAEELPNQEIPAEMIAKWGMNVEESSTSSTLVKYFTIGSDNEIPLLMKDERTVDYEATKTNSEDVTTYFLSEVSKVVDFWWEKVIFNKWGYPLFEKKDSIYRQALKTIKNGTPAFSYDLDASLKGAWTSLDSFVKYAEVKNSAEKLIWYFLLKPDTDRDFVYAPVVGEAKIGNQTFVTLQDAIDSANDGDEIKFLKDVVSTQVVEIKKSVTIDGDWRILDSAAKRWMWIEAPDVNVTIKNLTIKSSNDEMERAIQVNDYKNITLNVDNCDLLAKDYTINVINGASNTKMNISKTKVAGLAAINLWGKGGNVNIADSTLVGINRKPYNKDWRNDFWTLVVEWDSANGMYAEDYDIVLTNTTIESRVETEGNKQDAILFNNPSASNRVLVDGSSVLQYEGNSLVSLGWDKNKLILNSGIYSSDPKVKYLWETKCSIKNADSKYEVKDCPVATNFYTSNKNPIPVVLDGTNLNLEETKAVLKKNIDLTKPENAEIKALMSLNSVENTVEVKEVGGEKLLFVNVNKIDPSKQQTQVYREKTDGIFGANAFKNNTETEAKVVSISFDLKNAVAPSWVNLDEAIKSYNVVMSGGKEIWYTLHTKDSFGRFYAPKKYTITFDSNGGSKVEKITQVYGTTITPPANPTRSCYRFNGWSPAFPSSMPAENITLKAQWNHICWASGGWGAGSSSSASTTTPSTSVVSGVSSSVNTWVNHPVKPKVEVRNYSWDALPSLCSAEGSSFSEEQNHAYLWACGKDITTIRAISGARLDQPLTRAELAKMMSVYVTKVLGKQPVLTGVAQYPDVDSKMGDLADYIQLAYQLQIMGIHHDGTSLPYFEPNKFVTRAEFATVFSRVLYGAKYNQDGEGWANGHLNALKEAGILKNITPNMLELRGRVLLMLQRSTVAK